MQSLAKHYHQMIGLNDDWTIDSVELDMEAQTLSLALEFVGSKVKCPDCSTLCARKDKAPERTWRHLDTMQFQTLLTARVPRCSCETCGVMEIGVQNGPTVQDSRRYWRICQWLQGAVQTSVYLEFTAATTEESCS